MTDVSPPDVVPPTEETTVTCSACAATHDVRLPAAVPDDARDVRFECHADLLDDDGAPVLDGGVPVQCGKVTILLTRPAAQAAAAPGAVAVGAADVTVSADRAT